MSLYARVASILLAGLLVALGISVWLQTSEREQVLQRADAQSFSEQIANAVQLLEATPVTQRAAVLSALARAGLQADLLAPDAVHNGSPRGMLPTVLAQRLGSPREVRSRGAGLAGAGHGAGFQARSMDVRLQDGQWVRLTEQSPAPAAPGLSTALLLQLAMLLLLVAGVSLLAVRQATQPIQQLSAAAEALGQNLDAAPLPDQGSPEMRQAARTFNQMQSRIKSLLLERERALAAVSHDLRTPLTRLRLRSELVDDESLREQLGADIEAMANLINTTLDYLRERQTQEPVRPVNINALLESLVDDARAQGRTITLEGFAEQSWPVRLIGLRRALQNLIDNAFKYAGDATLVVHESGDWLHLGVRDHGPGIAASELTQVVQPYYRVDKARTDTAMGVGLGLSIVNEVARAHGGQLALSTPPQGGLCAMLILPRSA
jgi:signal transduction histidine kinase